MLLIGPPGAGKTVTAAKILTRAVMARRKIAAITIDTVRAGGVEQLAAITRHLKLELTTAGDPNALARALEAARDAPMVLVDGPGTNPFDPQDIGRMRRFLDTVEREPGLVIAAGGDVAEAGEMAEIYREFLGPTRLIATRLDIARRLGAVLVSAERGELKFCEGGVGPQVAQGLQPINPVSLARLLLPEGTTAASQSRRSDHGSKAIA